MRRRASQARHTVGEPFGAPLPSAFRRGKNNADPDAKRVAGREFYFVIASVSEAIQCCGAALDCFVAGAPRNDAGVANRGKRFYDTSSHSGCTGPDTPSKAPSISSATKRRAGSTGPGMATRFGGMRLKPQRP